MNLITENYFIHHKAIFSERKPIKITKKKYYKIEAKSTKNFFKSKR